jgi:UDP-N-acetyl-D-galactosamine dehydrogenase
VQVFARDAVADPKEAQEEYGVSLLSWDRLPHADALIAAVAHRQFTTLSFDAIGEKSFAVAASLPLWLLHQGGRHAN